MLRLSVPVSKSHVKTRSSTELVFLNFHTTKSKKDSPDSEHKISEPIPFTEITIGMEIGLGSYSCVYHGRWGDRIVAVKKMKYIQSSEEAEMPSAPDSGDAYKITLQQCENEANILSFISACNVNSVVRYEGSAIQKPFYYIVTEFMPISLTDYLKQPAISWDLRYEIIKGMIKCVADLHVHGVVHRDIKSDNYLLALHEEKESESDKSQQVQVKICDFGVATSKNMPKILGGFQGSTMWQAPEVLAEIAQTEASDVYSLAISIWEVATQKELYKGLDIAQIKLNVMKGERPAIPENCPLKIAKLITWGLKQKPEDRPTAAHMLNELNTGLESISPSLMEMKF